MLIKHLPTQFQTDSRFGSRPRAVMHDDFAQAMRAFADEGDLLMLMVRPGKPDAVIIQHHADSDTTFATPEVEQYYKGLIARFTFTARSEEELGRLEAQALASLEPQLHD